MLFNIKNKIVKPPLNINNTPNYSRKTILFTNARDEKNMKDQPILQCPHCNDFIIIEKINCGIFRHGYIIKNGIQICVS